jgi:hypothetical protein
LCPYKRKLKREVEPDWLRSFQLEPINQTKMTKAAAIDEHPSFLTVRPQVCRRKRSRSFNKSTCVGPRAMRCSMVVASPGAQDAAAALRITITEDAERQLRALPVHERQTMSIKLIPLSRLESDPK